MTDFVLVTYKNAPIEEYDKVNETFVNKVINYSEFLKTPLSLGMFVPYDEIGNILNKPEFYTNILNSDQEIKKLKYEEAKEKVIFEGFAFTESQKNSVNNNIQLSVSPYGLNNERLQLTKLKNGKFHTWFQLFTVEDLIQCDLECTLSF